jgi:hypothetical protein
MKDGKSYGDPAKLSSTEVSRRARRSVLRGDDSATYACGGAVKKLAKGGTDGVVTKGKTKGKIV